MQNSRRTALAADTRPGSSLRAWGIVTCCALTMIVADQWTKAWALRELTPHIQRPLVGQVLQLNLVFNPGAAFSMGSSMTFVFPLIGIVVVLGVVGYVVPRLRMTWWAVATGLFLAGIIGNLIDRFSRPPAPLRGEVVDFLMLPYWPIFNVADICICTAAGLFIVLTMWGAYSFDGSQIDKAKRPTKDRQIALGAQDPDDEGEGA